MSAVEIVGWIGLAGALVATLAILKLVALVLRSSRDVLACARIALAAARGIAAHVEPAGELERLVAPAGDLRRAAAELAQAVDRAAGALELAGGPARPRGG